ncbi:24442_t:CDS:2 [Racocetra persica]|uniref:24442_t:CDS:1 n=1 Tax=Racocetra persica TaxID=160502 RepID=A0ACA9K7R5_9GLOM|nr:24442_t:CDS:2 [Racocetra persica]
MMKASSNILKKENIMATYPELKKTPTSKKSIESDDISKARPTIKEAPTGQCYRCKKKHQLAKKVPNRAKQQLDDTNDARYQSTEQDVPNSEKKRYQLMKRALN